MTVFVRPEEPGYVMEQHTVTVPATGWDVPLDLRHPGALARLLGDATDWDPARGMIVLEFVGDRDLAGAGARTLPAAPTSLVYDERGRFVAGDRLVPRGHRLLVLAGVTGEVQVEVLAPPGLRCAPQATGMTRWVVEPGVLTQIDVECRAAAL